MVNAVFFKGTWLMQFEPNQTTQADFHALSGTRPVLMMKTKKQFPVGHVGSLNARALKLPYKASRNEKKNRDEILSVLFIGNRI